MPGFLANHFYCGIVTLRTLTHKHIMIRTIFFFLITLISGNAFANAVGDTSFPETPIVLHTATGDVFGTLTTPPKYQKIPVVLIIAGSGPTDRNCNSPMMKTDAYKMIAAELAQKNIASIRYDKRGIGESKAAVKSENELRFEDYVNDVKQWIRLIKKDKRFSTVIVAGHSEGSLTGMLACGAGADKFVSIAGPGQPADNILKEQFSTQFPPVREGAYVILDSLKKGMQVKNIQPVFINVFRPSVQPYLISWFKYNPADVIKDLRIPVLILQGTNDLQVKASEAALLHAANPKSELVTLEGVNHVLKKVEAKKEANIRSYNDPSLPVDENLINALITFIAKKK